MCIRDRATLLTQRQQLNAQGRKRLALADFIAPEGVKDYIGAMAVSTPSMPMVKAAIKVALEISMDQELSLIHI